jgi:glyoxylase-like metal-dependent hydrolase (beta-lactamase superfamily II)
MTISPFSRRDVLKGGGAAALLAMGVPLFSGPLSAKAPKTGKQAPAHFRFNLDDYEITMVSDGNIVLPTSFEAKNVDEAELKAFLQSYYLDPDTHTSQVNVCLINTGDELIMVDTGAGQYFLDSAGKLVDNLAVAGIKPEQIDKIILSHGHPDHVWGVIDDFEETPRFANASYAMNAEEIDFWTDEDAVNKVPEMFRSFATGAMRNLKPVKDKTTRTKDGTEIAPGIRVIDTPGHTLAHQSVVVERGGKKLLITGDAIHHWPIAFDHPDWQPIVDMDAEKAVVTRKRLMDMAATDKMIVAGYHMPFPGIGRIARKGQGYQWVPAAWEWNI